MICLVGHEIKTDGGFKVFEAGKDYPVSEIKGREKYFEKEVKAKKPDVVEEKKPVKSAYVQPPESERSFKHGRK